MSVETQRDVFDKIKKKLLTLIFIWVITVYKTENQIPPDRFQSN
jgi:hypothetical protein